MSAQYLAFVEQFVDFVVRNFIHALSDRPFGAGVILRLYGGQPANHVLSLLESRSGESLIAQAVVRDVRYVQDACSVELQFRVSTVWFYTFFIGGHIVATVRYLVNDVERSIEFYTKILGFKLDQSMAPAFARVSNNDLTLWLAGPKSSAARPMPDGRQPEPGGWNRFVLEIVDLESRVTEMKQAGLSFRNDVVTGPGGKQILLEDPDGNVIELFEAAR
jgi:catechol 2,3-dioxygenase-like lactoylglutathione lyase family enzyme